MNSNSQQLFRLEEDHVIIEISEVKLGELIENIRDRLLPKFEKSNFIIKFSKKRLPVLLTDVTWFELILRNLISRSIVGCPADKNIVIDVRTNFDRCTIEIVNQLQNPINLSGLPESLNRISKYEPHNILTLPVSINFSLIQSYAEYLNINIENIVSFRNWQSTRISNIKIEY